MKLRTWLLLGLAMLAAYMGARAARRESEQLRLLWALAGLIAVASTATAPKTRSTEARLNALVPVVFPNTGGTINGNVTVNGSHTVSGTVSAGTLQGTLAAGYVSGTVASANTANTANSATSASTATNASFATNAGHVNDLSYPQSRPPNPSSAGSTYSQSQVQSLVVSLTDLITAVADSGLIS
jgi:hypothetical protein